MEPGKIISIWNELPSSVVQKDTINGFKNELDKYSDRNELKYFFLE